MAYGALVAKVRLEHVSKTFGEDDEQVTAVDDVSLTVAYSAAVKADSPP